MLTKQDAELLCAKRGWTLLSSLTNPDRRGFWIVQAIPEDEEGDPFTRFLKINMRTGRVMVYRYAEQTFTLPVEPARPRQ